MLFLQKAEKKGLEYRYIFFDGRNEYYISKNQDQLRHLFNVQLNVFQRIESYNEVLQNEEKVAFKKQLDDMEQKLLEYENSLVCRVVDRFKKILNK